MSRANGLKARVIPVEKTVKGNKRLVGYQLYYHRPQSVRMSTSDLHLSIQPRAYPKKRKRTILSLVEEYESSGRIKNSGPRRGIFRRRSRSKGDKRDLEQVEDFIDYRDQALVKGKSMTEAQIIAEKLSSKNRESAVAFAKQEKKDKETEEELEIKREKLKASKYEAAVEDYKLPVPGREVLRYNSLEIAGATTGAVGGIALTSAGLVAMPWVPLAVAGGFVGAKLVRRNVLDVGIKDGVNWALDQTEEKTTALVQSLRVSKDNEVYPSSANPKALWLLRRPKVKPRKSKYK